MGEIDRDGDDAMINWLHAKFHQPKSGWDPIRWEHAKQYAEAEWRSVDQAVVDDLEKWVGGMAGKRVLDLGGGPGQYSIAFAERGADVTWHDVSRNYLDITQAKAREHGVKVDCSLGYLEDAEQLASYGGFDLVFNRICWRYARGDRNFARVVFNLVKPGGVGYVDTPNSQYGLREQPWLTQLRIYLNAYTGWKIGHPFSPRGRVACLLQAYDVALMRSDYQVPGKDRILFVRARRG